MINASRLLADLKRLRRVLDADLRAMHAAGAQRDVVETEYREAFDLGRTRDTFEAFLDSAFDQAVVHWVLGCVFLRFLEDNLLVDRPFLSGPTVSSELIRALKFSTCLSEKIAASTIEARLLDQDGIQETLTRTPRLLHSAQ